MKDYLWCHACLHHKGTSKKPFGWVVFFKFVHCNGTSMHLTFLTTMRLLDTLHSPVRSFVVPTVFFCPDSLPPLFARSFFGQRAGT